MPCLFFRESFKDYPVLVSRRLLVSNYEVSGSYEPGPGIFYCLYLMKSSLPEIFNFFFTRASISWGILITGPTLAFCTTTFLRERRWLYAAGPGPSFPMLSLEIIVFRGSEPNLQSIVYISRLERENTVTLITADWLTQWSRHAELQLKSFADLFVFASLIWDSAS